jgi:hypothetical protein
MSWQYGCPTRSGSSCVLSQLEGRDLVFYSLDAVEGKGQQLARIEAGRYFTGWGLSPDGSRLGLVRNEDKYKGRIEVLNLPQREWHEMAVDPEWGLLQSIAWAADGNGFFVTTWLPDSCNLLHIPVAGSVQPLLRNPRRQLDGQSSAIARWQVPRIRR